MALDEKLLAAARAAQERVVESERAVELARAEFRYSVRTLHLAGASLRDIGEALHLSHQRVHQIVEEADGAGRGWRSFTSRGRGAPGGAGMEPPRCSFCGSPSPGTGRFVAGNGGIGICDGCVAKVSEVLATGRVAATPVSAVKPVPADAAAAQCSFCGKRRDRVDGLAMAGGTAGGGITICTECVALCREIVAESLA